ncbi:MAG TPA: amine dehydrogenase large subunit, partial [Caulobacteraceae bacterium]|nr:amine dehydrogenase large subunit [Caulobacteraceae bacterium]
VAVVDLASPQRNLRAQIRAAQFGSFAQSRANGELYVAETFYSRMTRGERTDAIAVYDAATLAQTAEILLPGGRRAQSVTQVGSFRLVDHDTLGLVFNFTPAASVTVVDLVARKVLNEVEIPGCSLVYPTGPRGFFTLCGNGGLTSIQLDPAGGIASQVDEAPFNDIDNDPMFMHAAYAGGTAYFVTFKGSVRPIDASGPAAKVLPAWSLLSASAEEKTQSWRPSGWQVVAADDLGRLYVLMQKGGREGSHKDGGDTVWVFNVASHQRVAEINLGGTYASIEVTHGDKPLLVAAGAAGELLVLDAASGSRPRTLSGAIVHTPTVLQAAQ